MGISKKETIKVLMVFGEPFSFGGQESFALNAYKNISKKRVKIDFFTPFYADNQQAKELLEKNGSKIYCCGLDFYKARKKHFANGVSSFLAKHAKDYDIIHINSGSIFNLLKGAELAKKNGAKKVIAHSHATGFGGIKYKIIKMLSDRLIMKYVDFFAACSEDAGSWKFPRKALNSDKFAVFGNGIDIERFKFRTKVRREMRDRLSLKGKNVILNVGRFSPEKNQLFLLDIFSQYKQSDPKAFLIIIGGKGEEKEKVVAKISALGLVNDTLILENIPNVEDYMQAADLFLFPSVYEGLGIVVLEARAAGLPVVCSENVPNSIRDFSNIKSLSLNDNVAVWSGAMGEALKAGRPSGEKELTDAGYDGRACAADLELLYRSLAS